MNMHIIHNPKELYPLQQLKFYTPVAMLFVSLFIIANITAQKLIPFGNYFVLTAGDLIYPINYLLSIILTEVYGYAMSRRVIWTAFVCSFFVAIIISFSIMLPSASCWHEQTQYAMILGRTPRLLAASLGAFLTGEFIGTYVLAKMKVSTAGKYLWLRTIGATLIGQGIDGIAFNVMAFGGIISWHNVVILSITSYGCKVVYQTLLTPAIYLFSGFLKKKEQIDIFDRHTNFSPFNLGLK